MNITAALLASLNVTRAQFDIRCEEIAAAVASSDRLALAAVCRIYDRQTADEKNADRTVHLNGIGFQECDAKFGGKVARLHRKGYTIFPDKMDRVRRMAVKYRRQLTVLSFLKERAKREELTWRLRDDDTWVNDAAA